MRDRVRRAGSRRAPSRGRAGARADVTPASRVQVVRLELPRERRDEQRVAARLLVDLPASSRDRISAVDAPCDSVTIATTSSTSRPPSVHASHRVAVRRRTRPSSAARRCSGTSSSRHVARSMPGKRGAARDEVLRAPRASGRDAHCRSSSTSSTGPPSATSVSQPTTASYSGNGSPSSAASCAWSEAKYAPTSSGTSRDSWRAVPGPHHADARRATRARGSGAATRRRAGTDSRRPRRSGRRGWCGRRPPIDRANSAMSRDLPAPASPVTSAAPKPLVVARVRPTSSRARRARRARPTNANSRSTVSESGSGTRLVAADRPRHLVQRRRAGQALQVERADRPERRRAAGGGEVLHELRREDLTALGARAQPRRFGRRQPAHVVLLDDDLARAHADAHVQRRGLASRLSRASRVWIGGRGGDRVGRGREDRHRAVAEPLDDRPLVVGDRLGDDAFVPPFDLVGAVVTEAACATTPSRRDR